MCDILLICQIPFLFPSHHLSSHQSPRCTKPHLLAADDQNTCVLQGTAWRKIICAKSITSSTAIIPIAVTESITMAIGGRKIRKKPTIPQDMVGSWWTWRDSNPRPLGCEPNALPAELQARVWSCTAAINRVEHPAHILYTFCGELQAFFSLYIFQFYRTTIRLRYMEQGHAWKFNTGPS